MGGAENSSCVVVMVLLLDGVVVTVLVGVVDGS